MLEQLDPFQAQVRICNAKTTPSGGECNGACVANGGGSFTGSLCVMQRGTATCPAGFPTTSILYTGVDDSRGYSACSCGAPTLNCGGSGTTNIFPDNACAGSNVKNLSEGICADVGSVLSGSTRSVKPPQIMQATNSTCAGGYPTGAIQGIDPWTLCCP